MLWSFKCNGNCNQGYHNKNRAVKGLKYAESEETANSIKQTQF